MSVGGGTGGGNGGGSSSSSSLIGCSGVDLESRKWACEYCTYENWPASKRCTLCHAPRPPHLITDTVNEEQDIYKMADLVRPNNSEWCAGEGSSSGSSAGGGGSNKWACHLCTFLNWPRAARCTQCLTPRRKSSPTQSQTALQPANINISTGSGTAVSSSSSGSTGSMRTTPQRNSPSSPEAAKAMNNDINKTVATVGKSASSITPSSHSNKWACRVCTYENWPRSSKCVICGTSRGRTLSDSTIYLPGSQTAPSTALSPGSTGVSGLSSAMGGAGSEQQEVARRQGRASPSSPRSPDTVDPNNQDLAGASVGGAGTSSIDERKLKLLRKRLRDKDWLWLNACHGVVDGDPNAIEAFIAAGGNPSRQLTADELLLLARPSAFEVGHTLVHLALRFRREDMLAVLLAATDAAAKAVKRLPCHASPDLASDIRREIASSLRQRKGDFPCYFFTDCVSFALPADIEDLPRHIQEQLFDELLDRGVQNELEAEENIINWSVELTERLGSRLYALWNRTAGDCLLDSVLQATWGVFDVDNTLRRALADSLNEGAMTFYPRWKEYESKQAESLHFSLDEYQWQRDWAVLLSLASQPGASLEQTHIFALAHILRRPVIVYGVKYVKSFRGETLGLAKFQGVYLPLLWERSFCWKTPVALGYTRGHFSALVSMEMDLDDGEGAGANLEGSDEDQVAYLPLVDCEGKLLELHFLSGSEVGREELLLREWMDCYVTKGGLLVALQRRVRQPTAVKQMVDEWLDRYRQLATTQASPASNQHTISAHNFSSDGESDQE